MAPITMLRQIVKNGWTIANRKAIISQIEKVILMKLRY